MNLFRSYRSWLLLMVFAMPSSLAQTDAPPPTYVQGPLLEVRVEGTESYATLLKTVLRSRAGIDAKTINLEEEKTLAMELGVFREVAIRLEEQADGYVMIVAVRENPRVGNVRVLGSSLEEEQWLNMLAQGQLLVSGQVLNTIRAEQSIRAIQDIYRQQGFPFDVPVKLVVSTLLAARESLPPGIDPAQLAELEPSQLPPADAFPTVDLETVPDNTPVIVLYAVSETQELSEVRFEGATLLEESLLETIFAPLEQQKTFNAQLYFQALDNIAEAYRVRGYLGSKVDTQTSELSDGVLTVRFQELTILGIDTREIGIPSVQFSLKVGDLFNYTVLLEDIKRFSKGRDSDIILEPVFTNKGVYLNFRSGSSSSAGEITSVVLEGNTAIPTDELRPLLRLKAGDTFSTALASEDFSDIVRFYQERGYALQALPGQTYVSYTEGRYVLRLVEYKIAGYSLVSVPPNPKTNEDVITRYLPKPGSLYNRNDIQVGLRELASLGFIEPVTFLEQPAEKDDEVMIEVRLREKPSTQLRPEASFSTDFDSSDVSAGVVFEDTNFLGAGHRFGASLDLRTTDVGWMLGGGLDYDIPWIYNNPYYRDHPTSLSLSLFSNINNDESLVDDNGASEVCLDEAQRASGDCSDDEKIQVGDYTVRENGFGVKVGRDIGQDLTLDLSAKLGYSIYKLEPSRVCEYNADGTLIDNDCDLPDDEAAAFLPQSGWSTLLSSAVTYDTRDNPLFPRAGLNLTGFIGLGAGNDYRSPDTNEQASYAYIPLQFGVRTYLQLQDILPVASPSHVFAVKFTAGHQLGGDYPTSRYFSVGDTLDNNTLLRGFTDDDINASKTYAIGTLEYRYDFRLESIVTRTIIGYLYTDIGWASSVPGFEDYQTPLLAGAGLGVQLNLSVLGADLPAFRLDYSFSERNPNGIFEFRISSGF